MVLVQDGPAAVAATFTTNRLPAAPVAPPKGAPRIVFDGVDLNYGDRPVLRGTLHYVGFEVLKPFFSYHVPYIDDAARAARAKAGTPVQLRSVRLSPASSAARGRA